MESKEILEGNKLIADFMSIKVIEWKPLITPRLIIADYKGEIDFNDMDCYTPHSNWNQLMLVIERIGCIEFNRHEEEQEDGSKIIMIETHYPRTFGMLSPEGKPMFRFNCGQLHIADTLIEAAWQAVVEFIK